MGTPSDSIAAHPHLPAQPSAKKGWLAGAGLLGVCALACSLPVIFGAGAIASASALIFGARGVAALLLIAVVATGMWGLSRRRARVTDANGNGGACGCGC